MSERVTLVTGASAGIGAELARVFAANGHRLALAARREDRLVALAREITAKGGPAPIIIPCDLAAPDAGDHIAAALSAAGVELDHLVNNAGFGLFGKAIQLDRAEQLDMIAVNIRALTDLSLRLRGDVPLGPEVSSELSAADAYISRHGWLALDGEAVALAAVEAAGRGLDTLHEPAVLERVRAALAPELSLDAFVRRCVEAGGLAPLPGL